MEYYEMALDHAVKHYEPFCTFRSDWDAQNDTAHGSFLKFQELYGAPRTVYVVNLEKPVTEHQIDLYLQENEDAVIDLFPYFYCDVGDPVLVFNICGSDGRTFPDSWEEIQKELQEIAEL